MSPNSFFMQNIISYKYISEILFLFNLLQFLTLKAMITEHVIQNNSHTVIAELVLDPLETVSYTTFKLSLHCQYIIGLDPLLPLKL